MSYVATTHATQRRFTPRYAPRLCPGATTNATAPTPHEQTLDAENYGDWEGNAFAPEAAILEALAAVEGVSSIETQTYTFMTM